MSRTLFSLGKLYPSDFLKPHERPHFEPVELKLIMDDNGIVSLDKSAPDEALWGRYWYRSGVNPSMKDELKDIVASINSVIKFPENSIWCDVACNDGSLLSFVPEKFIRIGIDPADDSFKQESEKHADLIIQNYFSAEVYKLSTFGKQKVSCLTSIAMFYDLDSPKDFIKGVYEILDDNGIWVMQLSYSPLMILQTAFDNICHEHKVYYSLFNVMALLNAQGFDVVDCQLNAVNGGSFRLYIMKNIADKRKFGSQPYRDVCSVRIKSVLEYENSIGMNKPIIWFSFFDQIQKLKRQVYVFIQQERARGKRIWAYGASTKGNTLLQYFQLDNTLIEGVADRNVDKWGLRTIGTNILIYPESVMRSERPDYLLILPWHFVNEFKERESEYLKSGGRFIVPCPKFEVI